MRGADLGRAVLGGVLLICPAIAPRALGERPSSVSDAVVRVLAVRMLVQASAGALALRALPTWRRPVFCADVVVEALHSASMLGLGALVPARRRIALVSAALAASFAVADAVQSAHHAEPPAGADATQDGGIERPARLSARSGEVLPRHPG